VALLSVGASAQAQDSGQRVDAMLAGMSLDTMLGQMTQLDVSTVLLKDGSLNKTAVREHARLGVGSYLNTPSFDSAGNSSVGPPLSATQWRTILDGLQHVFVNESGGIPVLYGLDSVHGANYVRGAVSFGQQLNAAASFNVSLVSEVGAITARDTLAAGIPWVFAPILDISQNALWSRTFETFGEDPHLASVMADTVIRGLQRESSTAACMKHLIGYSKTPTGHDRDGVTLSDYDLLNYFAPSFLAAIRAGVKAGMETYASVNGVPVVANSRILEQLVRHDMGFDGLIVTDWAEINNLHDWHRVAKSKQDAVRMTLQRTTLDMTMEPYDAAGFIASAKAVVASSPDLLPRIRKSARRVLQLKMDLGLFDTPVPGATYVQEVGQDSDREVALNLARESIVLVKNDNSALPLPKTASKVLLTGHAADSVGLLCGGWTVRWQGISTLADAVLIPKGISLKSGIANVLGNDSSVKFANALYANGSYSREELEVVKASARNAEFTVVAIGEDSYAEKPGDINDLDLPLGQVEYVRELASTGTKIVLVLVQGRPRLLQGIADLATAVVYAMLPGEVGGQAIAEILFGDVNPSGRLPISYPKDAANVAIPYNHRVTTRCADGPCEMQWSFGHGLSYTSFQYDNLTLESPQLSASGIQHVTLSVRNTGSVAGQDTVLLFLIQPFRELAVPEFKMLKKFRKLTLQPGEQAVVTFELTADDWGVYDPQIGNGFRRVVEQGDYVVAIGSDTDCDVYASEAKATPPTLGDAAGTVAAPTSVSPLRNSQLCARFTITETLSA
jgi:beta-glucosidase